MSGLRIRKYIKWTSFTFLRLQDNMKSESIVSTETSLHHNISDLAVSTCGKCSEPTDCRTTVGREEVDSVFKTTMLGATQVDGQVDRIFQNFLYEDTNH